jgi:hypothetical protein
MMENKYFFKQLKTELLYEPVILLLGIYPKELKTFWKRNVYTNSQYPRGRCNPNGHCK